MSSDTSKAQLMIQLIDEVVRGRSRLHGHHNFHGLDELKGLPGLILTATVGAAHPPTVPQIGRSLGYPRQTIQRNAELLVRLGLVVFVENPDHKRAHRLTATPEGAELQSRADELSRRWAARLTADLPAEDLAVTVQTLRAIRHNLEAEVREIEPAPGASVPSR
jgi:DNA-binding MarR family transcriptional regulator